MEDKSDRESSVVANVLNVFPNVQVNRIYSLIDPLTKLNSPENYEDVEMATQKICNFLLENFDEEVMVGTPMEIVAAPSNSVQSQIAKPPLIDIDTSNDKEFLDVDDVEEEPGLMDLANLLAGNGARRKDGAPKPKKMKSQPIMIDLQPEDVPEVAPANTQSNAFVYAIESDPETLVPKNELLPSINQGAIPKTTKKVKKTTVKRRKTKAIEIDQIIDDVIKMTEEKRIDVDLDEVDTPKDIIDINHNEVNGNTTEVSSTDKETTDQTKPVVPLETEESPKQDSSFLAFATTVPNLDRTVTDVDVLFECGCCYNDVPFDYMVQCTEGHLFCCQCLEQYAKESVYGHGKGDLKCMTSGCDEVFPRSQLSRALPVALYKKYEERISDESVNSAGLENFVRCTSCNYGAELDPEQIFFHCPNCSHRFCRKCQEAFKDHEGLRCDQVEKDTETKIRTDYEEKMAEAKIRTCVQCKSRFTKDSGCNKITCRCGKTMCYVCRESGINYNHFCQHVREPTKDCKKCKACFLWSNAEQDDKLAIDEIKKDAVKARNNEGFVEEREIGAPNEAEPAGANNARSQMQGVAAQMYDMAGLLRIHANLNNQLAARFGQPIHRLAVDEMAAAEVARRGMAVNARRAQMLQARRVAVQHARYEAPVAHQAVPFIIQPVARAAPPVAPVVQNPRPAKKVAAKAKKTPVKKELGLNAEKEEADLQIAMRMSLMEYEQETQPERMLLNQFRERKAHTRRRTAATRNPQLNEMLGNPTNIAQATIVAEAANNVRQPINNVPQAANNLTLQWANPTEPGANFQPRIETAVKADDPPILGNAAEASTSNYRLIPLENPPKPPATPPKNVAAKLAFDPRRNRRVTFEQTLVQRIDVSEDDTDSSDNNQRNKPPPGRARGKVINGVVDGELTIPTRTKTELLDAMEGIMEDFHSHDQYSLHDRLYDLRNLIEDMAERD